jgi:hypothetical protein
MLLDGLPVVGAGFVRARDDGLALDPTMLHMQAL